ncbi:glycosyltransferase family 2 protein [bacterium]|nr:glycosyltransferase family 2 protein [bacterium]
MNLSIVIVNYKVKDLLDNCLKSIFSNSENIKLDVIVVDNDSQDGSLEMIKNKYPQVNLIASDKNLGFAKANNLGFKQAKYDYILLLNPDMKLYPDTLENTLKWTNTNPQADVIGCHLVNQKGQTIPHVRQFPTFLDQLAIVLKLPHLFPNILNKYLQKNFNYSQAKKVDSIRGAFFLMHRKIYEKLKGLDERYFIWFEEVDFCKQVQKNGGEVWYTPVAKCIDYVGKSFAQVPRGVTQKYFKDSMLKYFQKWHPSWQYSILKIAWILGTLISKINIKPKIKT